MTGVQVSIIIVNWNAQPHLCNCLYSIFHQSEDAPSFEIVLVDNASTDDSVQAVRTQFPDVKIIENKENKGFAAANNQGIGVSAGEYILLLNPDTLVHDGSLRALLDVASQYPQVGVLGPQLLNVDGTVQPSVMGFPSLSGMVRGFLRAWVRGVSKTAPDKGEEVVFVPAVSGACLLVRQQLFDQVGLLDASYFIYCEELDFCYRASRKGWQVAYVPSISITHLGGQSTRQCSDAMYVERRRSRVRFLLYHRGLLHAFVGALLAEVFIVFRVLVSIVRGDRPARWHLLRLYHQAVYPVLFSGRSKEPRAWRARALCTDGKEEGQSVEGINQLDGSKCG